MAGKVRWTVLLVASPYLVLLALGLFGNSNGFNGIQAAVLWTIVVLGLLWVWVIHPLRRKKV
jgi:hypothetical protein